MQLVAHTVAPAGSWTGEPVDTVVLDYEARFRRRILLTGEKGTHVLLNLAEAQLLADGDALVTDEGEHIAVKAAPEALIEIHCHNGLELLQMAWHLGNRHLATEISEGSLRIRYDKVILDMIHQLGAHTHLIEAPFNPEGGAYKAGATAVHGHDHHHHH
ncbi:MAG: urease accessory protein UreE [Alphaproteobacteria bacterium]|nr:MAG: urease accessory protein UreE [Alphaproteobacteria bacterium]